MAGRTRWTAREGVLGRGRSAARRLRTGGVGVGLALLLSVGAAVPAEARAEQPGHGRESATHGTGAVAGTYARGARGPGGFGTFGDLVHISSSAPRTASAHGWWRKYSGAGSKAKVTVWLQVRAKKGKKWHTVAKGVRTIKPAKPRSRKPSTTARKKCNNHQRRQWRSLIDVDIVGVADSPEKAYTKTVVRRCGV